MQANSWLPNTNAPLLAFRLTTLLPSQRSVLGVKWAHILGDAAACHHFLRVLSFFYTNPGTPLPATEYPNFGPHISLPASPTRGTVERFDIPQIQARAMEDMQKAFREDAKDGETVIVTLARGELRRMNAECLGTSGERLSDQDVLSG